MSGQGWQQHAACRGADSERFGPDLHREQAAATILEFCHHCPVTAECHQAAVDGHECGIWGARLFTSTGHRHGRGLDELVPRYDQRNDRIKPRGICRGCGHERALKFGGHVAMHRVDGTVCDGTDYLPRPQAS